MNPTPALKSVASPRLEANGIAKYYGHFTALEQVTLLFEPGEFAVVLGRNGAGKTTLLRILGLLVQPSAGELRFDGKALSAWSAVLKARLGFVGHESFLYDELTVRENLGFYARLYGSSDTRASVAEVLEEMELGDRGGDLVRNLSRGLRQRAAIARALLHHPQILLLDEPATGLDAPASDRLYELLGRWHQAGRTVVFSSHDFTRGLSLAGRVVLLERGRVVLDGKNTVQVRAAVAAQLGGAQ